MMDHLSIKQLARGAALAALGLWSTALLADEGGFMDLFARHKEVEPVRSALYQENCGECHFAYQPGLLPARSWRALLAPDALADHFGENAELDETDRQAILDFLVAHAADDSRYKRSIKIRRSIPAGETPLRITDVPYIRHKHREIPAAAIRGNDKVRTLSNCDACHRQAAQGIYDDDTVLIPGQKRRRWW